MRQRSASGIPTEQAEQALVIQWAAQRERATPDLRWLCAVPNGGGRTATEAKILRGQGVRAGWPDLQLLAARGPWHGIVIEMKRTDGGAGLTVPQLDALQWAHAQHLLAIEAWGAQAAIECIRGYLAGDPRLPPDLLGAGPITLLTAHHCRASSRGRGTASLPRYAWGKDRSRPAPAA